MSDYGEARAFAWLSDPTARLAAGLALMAIGVAAEGFLLRFSRDLGAARIALFWIGGAFVFALGFGVIIS